MQPMVLMPYLPGPESSVDMLVEKGKVIAAVARRKEGSVQHLHQSGAAFELAKSSAELMQADGLVNVQTRCDHHGNRCYWKLTFALQAVLTIPATAA